MRLTIAGSARIALGDDNRLRPGSGDGKGVAISSGAPVTQLAPMAASTAGGGGGQGREGLRA